MGKRNGWDKGKGYKSHKGAKAQGKEYKAHFQDGKKDKYLVRNKGQKNDYGHEIIEKSGKYHESPSKKGKRTGGNKNNNKRAKTLWDMFWGN